MINMIYRGLSGRVGYYCFATMMLSPWYVHLKLTTLSKPLLVNVNKDLSTWKTVIADRAFKGKSTISVISVLPTV